VDADARLEDIGDNVNLFARWRFYGRLFVAEIRSLFAIHQLYHRIAAAAAWILRFQIGGDSGCYSPGLDWWLSKTASLSIKIATWCQVKAVKAAISTGWLPGSH
jgi:hypothetical protein